MIGGPSSTADDPGSGTPIRELTGIVPAAGRGERLGCLPYSKELLTVGFDETDQGRPRPRVAADSLLEHMKTGGAQTAYVVLRRGKWDIAAHFGPGGVSRPRLAYVVTPERHGVPFSVDAALTFVSQAHVLFGFPDILIRPSGAFVPLVERLASGTADVVLGLFPCSDPAAADQVRLDDRLRVREVRPRSADAPLDFAWLIAAWRPAFSAYLRSAVATLRASETPGRTPEGLEITMGHLLDGAVRAGLLVEGVPVDEGSFLDVGTPTGLATAWSGWKVGSGPAVPAGAAGEGS